MAVLTRVLCVVSILAAFAIPAHAEGNGNPKYPPPPERPEWVAKDPASASARDFVTKFYAWYVDAAWRDSIKDQRRYVVNRRGTLLAPQLRKALQADFASQDKTPGYLSGLDYDPFLSSQDPDPNYKVAEVTRKDALYRVRVFHYGEYVEAGNEMQVEVVPFGKAWQIRNIYYHRVYKGQADGWDLLGQLKKLAEQNAPAPAAKAK